MPTTISDLFDLVIDKGTKSEGCDLTLYLYTRKSRFSDLGTFARNEGYQVICKLAPKDLSEEYKTNNVFNYAYKYKHKYELPYSIDFFSYESFREFLFKYKPENTSIEEFLDPIIRSGYKDAIDFDYMGLAYVSIAETDAYNDPDLEETIKKKVEEYFQMENPKQILLEIFGYNELKDPIAEQEHKIHHRFYGCTVEVNFIGMTYKLFVHHQYIEDPRSLIDIFLFNKMSEELDSNGKHIGRFILPFRIKLRLEKDTKSNCPPFSKELNIDTIYKDGVPMNTRAIQKKYRLCMDFLKYHDKLEVTQRLKDYSKNSTYKYAENFIQIRKDCSDLNSTEKRIREAIKGDENLTNEEWLALIIRCAMFLNNGLSLHKDGINDSFISSSTKELDISKKGGFAGDFRLSLLYSGDSRKLLSPKTIVEKLNGDLEDLKIWTEGFKEIIQFLKSCFSEEEMNLDLTMEDFVIKVLSRTIPADPLSVINSVNRVKDHELCSYLRPAEKIARELL